MEKTKYYQYILLTILNLIRIFKIDTQ